MKGSLTGILPLRHHGFTTPFLRLGGPSVQNRATALKIITKYKLVKLGAAVRENGAFPGTFQNNKRGWGANEHNAGLQTPWT